VLLRATENAVAGHIWPVGRYFPTSDLKHEITLAKNLLLEESKLSVSHELFFHSQLLKKLRLIVTGSCNSSRHQRFMREKFFINEISENIPRNSMTSERLGNIDLLSVERYELKNIFR